uniref:Uncharacterized protein n=1 Tax=Plectus sambesii TaxID=2011161 RepID=A0A914WRH3_9BILA
MQDIELVSQIATLKWLAGGDTEGSRQLITAITAGRVGLELFERITRSNELDQLQAQVALKIADYVNKHPRASEDELVRVVRAELAAFRQAVQLL